MKLVQKKLKIIVADPCYDHKGLSTPVIPLGAGLVAAHTKKEFPEFDVDVFKAVTPLIKEIKNNPPDIIGLTNYLWNNNLSITVAEIAKKANPNVLIVFGGPEIEKNPKDFIFNKKKYELVDIFVQHEGEIAFVNLIRKFIEKNYKKRDLIDSVSQLGNCFVLGKEEIISGPHLHRIEDLDYTPSPYLLGMFDKFLSDPGYMPMIQTNRGCPFSCTFCQEGQEYFNKVRRHSLKFVQEELNYISKKVRPDAGLWITDSNWAMYKWDEDIADHISSLQKNIGWPRELITSTGKAQLERIIRIAKKLNNSMFISNSVQSMDVNVLKDIKRKNLSPKELEKNKESLKTIRQEPEIIVPLPNETKKTFFEGINKLLDSGSKQRFAVFQALVLTNTEMAHESQIKKFGLKIKYKQHWNLYGRIEGKFICEVERVVCQTNTMSKDDYLDCRAYAMLLDSILRFEPISEIFRLLESHSVKNSSFASLLFRNINNAPSGVKTCIQKFKDDLDKEMLDSEEEVLNYMKKNEEKFNLGISGGGNLRYSNMLWIDYFEDTLNHILETMRILLKDKKNVQGEINNIEKFLKFVYADRLNSETPKVVSEKFDYDILDWAKSNHNSSLSNFKKSIVYNFLRTKVSNLEALTIWQDFGFKLDKAKKDKPVGFDTRLYISKLRRDVQRQ